MTTLPVETGASPAPQGLAARFIGVITSPRATFAGIAAHPRWFGMLAVCCVLMALLVGGFLATKVGQEAWLDAASSGPFSREMSDEQYQGMEKMAAFAGYMGAAQMLLFVPVMILVISGILFAVFNAALGGDASFKQVFTVVVHALPIGVLGQLFTMPLNYARGTMSSATNLAVLLPMLDEASFVGRFLGMIDLFLVWQLVVLAIGLGVLYRRRTQPIAMSLLGAYAVIALVIAAVMSRMGGSGQ